MSVGGVATNTPLAGVGIDSCRRSCEGDVVDAHTFGCQMCEEESPELEVLKVP